MEKWKGLDEWSDPCSSKQFLLLFVSQRTRLRDNGDLHARRNSVRKSIFASHCE